jgi:hypothetical protein
MMQLRHVAGEALLARSALAHSNLAFDGLAEAAMAFFQCCTGVLARIALASLPTSSCPCCRSCAGIVAKLAFEGPASAALAFAGVALAFFPHPAGVIASIMLLLLSPVLRRRCHPWCVGVFALVARPSW